MMQSGGKAVLGIAIVGAAVSAGVFGFFRGPVSSVIVAAEENSRSNELQAQYPAEIRPLLGKYCAECHSGDVTEAEIDINAFGTLQDVRKGTAVWRKIQEMLHTEQMPPKESPQPTEAERKKIEQWIHTFLRVEAERLAGDPGEVILRRLNNAEYTYSLRDLTGIATLEPASEFPVDGAAGEGFSNTGAALVMSPSLLAKYLDAAKKVGEHLVLLPDGFRFSEFTTQQDQTNEVLDQIRKLYADYTAPSQGEKVNLQGIIFDTNGGGRLPVEKYLMALIRNRDDLNSGRVTAGQLAEREGLSPKYMALLWTSFQRPESAGILGVVREQFRKASPDDLPALVKEIGSWQQALWKFTLVGHIGKRNGPKRWMETNDPVADRQTIRYKLPQAGSGQSKTVALIAREFLTSAGQEGVVIWERPRIVSPGLPDLLLKESQQFGQEYAQWRERFFQNTAKSLDLIAAYPDNPLEILAQGRQQGVDEVALKTWIGYLGLSGEAKQITDLLPNKVTSQAGYDFVQGWRRDGVGEVLANSSDQLVRIPGNAPPKSVVVHPSPENAVIIGWRSPQAGPLRLEGVVTHAHPECGNGVTWTVELRRNRTIQHLATGIAHGAKPVVIGPLDQVMIEKGDMVSLRIGPRDGNHSCDLTAVNLKLTAAGDQPSVWDLSADVSGTILSGNPHADRYGHKETWFFFTEPEKPTRHEAKVPTGSLLAQWQTASGLEKKELAARLQRLLVGNAPAEAGPNADLWRELTSMNGSLFRFYMSGRPSTESKADTANTGASSITFGRHPLGGALDANSLAVPVSSVVQFDIPSGLLTGGELVVDCRLESQSPAGVSATLDVRDGLEGLSAGVHRLADVPALQNSAMSVAPDRPVIVSGQDAIRQNVQKAFDEFRELFPASLCYTKIVPVDEVVTLTLFYREDDHLSRLMLNEVQQQELERLWSELRYISQDALAQVDAFQQLMEYATQDSDPGIFEPLRIPINERAAAFRELLTSSQPSHVDHLVKFAARAFRQPLTPKDEAAIRNLYLELREKDELAHEDAVLFTFARILIAPEFLYRLEVPGPGAQPVPVTDRELINRLSYFLWSSLPDEELSQLAENGQIRNPDVLRQQVHRMLKDPRVRRLATEFACQWTQIYDFDKLDEKSEEHFPTFADLRGEMYEESILYFQDFFQENRSVPSLIEGDHAFLNERLANHYQIPGVTGENWRRVEGVRQHGRGGILTQATMLSKHSGASRTSPTLRGTWISDALLGEKIPPPPKDVPLLPEDPAALQGLTVRQLVEKHSSDPRCAGCHVKVDPLGFALEAYDSIGRLRDKDEGDLPFNLNVTAPDGAQFSGMSGLRDYLASSRRDAFLRQFSRKLLGYSLGRTVALSDELLLDELQQIASAPQAGIEDLIYHIVVSPQFQQIRGREMLVAE